jgi:membrane carboxypeptidase/penicillin-binding protein
MAGITVAVRIGFDDNRPLGEQETGGRTALPIFREIMLRVYQDHLVGTAQNFPREIEDRIDRYLAMQAAPDAIVRPDAGRADRLVPAPGMPPPENPGRPIPRGTARPDFSLWRWSLEDLHF